MHPDLHRYLDGEIGREALDARAAAELAEWEALERAAAVLRETSAPTDLEYRVMSALPERARPVWRSALEWLVRPRTFTLRPAVPLAAALAAVALVLVPRVSLHAPALDPRSLEAVAAREDATVYVQFVFAAADAQAVQVAGDFNEWQPEGGQLRDVDGDGVWTGLVAMKPGLHKYMFLVNGREWVTDPRAERYVDDGFGMRNALIAVAAPKPEQRS